MTDIDTMIPSFIPDDWKDQFAELGYDSDTAKIDEKGVSINKIEPVNPFPVPHYFTWENIRGVIRSADKYNKKGTNTSTDIDSMIPAFISRNWRERLAESDYDPTTAKIDDEGKGITVNKVSPNSPPLPHFFTWERLWRFVLPAAQKAKIDRPYNVPGNWLFVLIDEGYDTNDMEQEPAREGVHIRRKGTGEIEFLSWDSISDMCAKHRLEQRDEESKDTLPDANNQEWRHASIKPVNQTEYHTETKDPCAFHPKGFTDWRDYLPPGYSAVSTSRRGIMARDESGTESLLTWASLRGDTNKSKANKKLPKDWLEQMAALGYHYGSGSLEGKKKAKFFDEARHKGFDHSGHDQGWEYIYFSATDVQRMINDTSFIPERKRIVLDARQRLEASQQERRLPQPPQEEPQQLDLETDIDAQTLLRLVEHWRDVQRNTEELSRSLYQLRDFMARYNPGKSIETWVLRADKDRLQRRVDALTKAIEVMSERNQ